jgi:predicted Zn finger-like uncharacterized protein
MFTICPKCALTLVVTAADLRVAQGYVRCGRCSSVFNALARLTDERAGGVSREEESPPGETSEPLAQTADAAGATAPEAALPEESVASQGDDDDDAIPDDALEFDPTRTDLSAVFVDPPPNPQWTAATGSFKAMIAAKEEPAAAVELERDLEVEVDAAFLASMLRSEAADTMAAHAHPAPSAPDAAPEPATPPTSAPAAPPAQSVPTALSATPTPPVTPNAHQPRPRTAPALPPPSRTRSAVRHAAPHTRPHFEAKSPPPPGAHTVTPGDPSAEPIASALEEPAAARGRPEDTDHAPAAEARRFALPAHLVPHVWRVGAAVGGLLLLAQILDHYRDDLAATARFNRPLTALYGAFGVRLAPHWDVHAYDVRQLGASVEPGTAGLITVRASIKNGAQHPQPLPLLRVTLQDRFGNRIASSDVAPRFYLPAAVPASSFLSGGQRIDAEMGFVDPGTNAVGFEIDACLPSSSGGVTCANDVTTR